VPANQPLLLRLFCLRFFSCHPRRGSAVAVAVAVAVAFLVVIPEGDLLLLLLLPLPLLLPFATPNRAPKTRGKTTASSLSIP
jgi:hypothetical protein